MPFKSILKKSVKNIKIKDSLRNIFCFIVMAGIVLLIARHYFIDNGRHFYILGIALMIAGFIGINKTS